MTGILGEPEIKYVLEHLGHHLGQGENLFSRIIYGGEGNRQEPYIFIPASKEPLHREQVIHIDGIPVLYPGSIHNGTFYSFRDNNLEFHHDLLKSVFHLLSGYEELKNRARDEFGRFPYRESLQYSLGITGKPIVNYYFRIILEGLEEFAGRNGMSFSKVPVLDKPILMLSHDIDRIGGYSFFETGFRFKQLMGIAPSPFNLRGRFRDAFTSLFHLLNPFSRRDPFWTFDTMMQWESERDIRSTYFFLEKEGHRRINSRYYFHERRFRNLFKKLSSGGHEIGIHGTIQSAISRDSMERSVRNLREASEGPVTGIRQHFLKFVPNDTALIQEECGLEYDASLGYAEHDGFRNSYCWPFRLFDFQNNRTMDLWEIPLNLMDVTHFIHRQLDLKSSLVSVEELVSEVVRFNGVFSLLWHNHFFDDRENPGITNHYLGILDQCISKNLQGLTGREIIDRFKSSGASGSN